MRLAYHRIKSDGTVFTRRNNKILHCRKIVRGRGISNRATVLGAVFTRVEFFPVIARAEERGMVVSF